ncbi:4138_t:CDS:2, partial [Cetraspora pellucida]
FKPIKMGADDDIVHAVQSEDSKSIEMGADDDYLVHAVREACESLKFLYQIYKGSEHATSLKKSLLSKGFSFENQLIKFNELVKQTRNIIVRFIQLYPIVWRLLDIRFGLLNILIEAREYQLIKYILFNEKKAIDDPEARILNYLASKSETNEQRLQDIDPDPNSLLHEKSLHMPQYSEWDGGINEKKNAIRRVLEDDDPIFLGYFLEYYSNKAVEEIGWMITVSEILPDLHDEKNENYGFYKSYIQLLFHKPCFCVTELNIPLFEFLEIPPSINNSLEVYIPLTQLISDDSKLEVKEISRDKIPDIQMLPLINFTTHEKISFDEGGGNIYKNFLKALGTVLHPSKYVDLEKYPIPFLLLVDKVENYQNDPFYYNPSMEAAMNFM